MEFRFGFDADSGAAKVDVPPSQGADLAHTETSCQKDLKQQSFILEETKANKKVGTVDAYRSDLNWFLEHVGTQSVVAVTRSDIIRLMGREELRA